MLHFIFCAVSVIDIISVVSTQIIKNWIVLTEAVVVVIIVVAVEYIVESQVDCERWKGSLCKEVVVVYFMVLSQHFPERREEKDKKLSWEPSLGQASNPEYLTY